MKKNYKPSTSAHILDKSCELIDGIGITRANIIKRAVSKDAKTGVHRTATSYDIVDSANMLRYKDVFTKVLCISGLLPLSSPEEAQVSAVQAFSPVLLF